MRQKQKSKEESNDLEAARSVAFRYLGFTARSSSEMAKRLARSEFTAEVIEGVVAELVAQNYLDDEKFAADWVEDRADRKRYGRRRLSQELSGKGIDKDTIQEAIGTVSDDDELRRAVDAAQAKWRSLDVQTLNRAELDAEKRRLTGFLQRRGFSFAIIKKVFDTLIANTDHSS